MKPQPNLHWKLLVDLWFGVRGWWTQQNSSVQCPLFEFVLSLNMISDEHLVQKPSKLRGQDMIGHINDHNWTQGHINDHSFTYGRTNNYKIKTKLRQIWWMWDNKSSKCDKQLRLMKWIIIWLISVCICVCEWVCECVYVCMCLCVGVCVRWVLVYNGRWWW